MKRVSSQIVVAIVCCILGFMLAYQFRMLTRYQKKPMDNKSASDITVENEMYKKEKTEMQKKIDELQGQIKKYEESAGNAENNQEIINELERTRMLIGSTDVEGPGIKIYIKPSTNAILGNNVQRKKITDQDLVLLINELRFAGAEAIAIKDYRVTARTGIKISGGGANSFIMLDEQRKISQDEQIVISAIGNKELLYGGLKFRDVLNFIDAFYEGQCVIDIEKFDKITIPKSNMSTKFEYAKPVK